MSANSKLPPPPAGNGSRATAPPPPPASGQPTSNFAVVSGRKHKGQPVLLYGPGGIGKSTLASLAPDPVFVDVGNSTDNMDVPRVEGIKTFQSLRSCIQSSTLDAAGTIILDDWTTTEELIKAHVLETVTNDRNSKVENIEAFGFGKGYQHVYDKSLLLLQDFERHLIAGRHVIIVAHDCTTNVPNPMSEDFIRFEPFMQTAKGGKSSIRERYFQWVSHVLFLGYDVATNKGKGIGAGTRTIYTYEMPTHRAKSRTVREALPFESADDARIWSLILNQGA